MSTMPNDYTIQRMEKLYNLHLLDFDFVAGRFDVPYLFPVHVDVNRLAPFHQVKTFRGNKQETGVHFFLDDYQFERLWNRLERYVPMLKSFRCVLSPDFSMYNDMPVAMQIWNHYRKMTISQFLQRKGAAVVPTLNWSREESFAFCFDGMPIGGTVATSTLGAAKTKSLQAGWVKGMQCAVQKLQPKTILCYGSPIEFDAKGAEVVVFTPEHLVKVRCENHGKKRINKRTQFLIDHLGIIFNAAKKYHIPYDEWEELRQETILKSLEGNDRFDAKKGNIATWATRFAIQTAFHFKRKLVRKMQRETSLEE